ncbi:hypothetical protein NC652_007834 [Populus alba x Populus x berolinensis]|nr:hypothetical protein NC652_007834 [Populus alba x Populus x berolinensis]
MGGRSSSSQGANFFSQEKISFVINANHSPVDACGKLSVKRRMKMAESVIFSTHILLEGAVLPLHLKV